MLRRTTQPTGQNATDIDPMIKEHFNPSWSAMADISHQRSCSRIMCSSGRQQRLRYSMGVKLYGILYKCAFGVSFVARCIVRCCWAAGAHAGGTASAELHCRARFAAAPRQRRRQRRAAAAHPLPWWRPHTPLAPPRRWPAATGSSSRCATSTFWNRTPNVQSTVPPMQSSYVTRPGGAADFLCLLVRQDVSRIEPFPA